MYNADEVEQNVLKQVDEAIVNRTKEAQAQSPPRKAKRSEPPAKMIPIDDIFATEEEDTTTKLIREGKMTPLEAAKSRVTSVEPTSKKQKLDITSTTTTTTTTTSTSTSNGVHNVVVYLPHRREKNKNLLQDRLQKHPRRKSRKRRKRKAVNQKRKKKKLMIHLKMNQKRNLNLKSTRIVLLDFSSSIFPLDLFFPAISSIKWIQSILQC